MASWIRRAVAGLGIVIACNCASADEKQCRAAYDARLWQEASSACAKAATLDRPEIIILTARALNQNGKPVDALVQVERAFGSAMDAIARQVAGSLHAQRGDTHRAAELLSEALRQHRAAGDHAETARDARWLVGVELRDNRLTDAVATADLCVREAREAGDRRLEGLADLAQAETFATIGDEQSARRAFTDAGSLLGRWPRDVAWLLLKHGIFVRDLGDSATAIKLLTDAKTVGETARVPDVRTAASLNLAAIEAELGHAAAARRELDALPAEVLASPAASYVAGLIAAAPGGDPAEAERMFQICADNPPDDDYAWDCAYQLGKLAERTAPGERAEQLYRQAIKIVESIRQRTPTLELRPWILARRRAPYEALFALLANRSDGPAALEIAEQLNAHTWLDAVVTRAGAQASRSLAGPVVAAAPLSGQALLSQLGDREMLVYVGAQSTVWRIHLRSKKVVELTPLPDKLWSAVSDWRDRPDDLTAAEQLGALLLPDLTSSSEPLYVIAPDRLADVPFAALRRANHFLIEDRTLLRLPGIAALRCTARAGALGSPVLIADAQGNLAHARREVEHAASVVGARADVGPAATIGRLAQARGARLLHAAVHGEGGALVLFDGRLAVPDIIARGIDPEVAVLAGCRTGRSRDGEGWGALPSAFLVVGTRTIVATLRPVADADAAALMNIFYDKQGAQHPGSALREAQRTLARTAQPHAWAWFAAWGHAEPSECDQPSASGPP